MIAIATIDRLRKMIFASNFEYDAYLAVVTIENRMRLVGPDHCRMQASVTAHKGQKHSSLDASALTFSISLKFFRTKARSCDSAFGPLCGPIETLDVSVGTWFLAIVLSDRVMGMLPLRPCISDGIHLPIRIHQG